MKRLIFIITSLFLFFVFTNSTHAQSGDPCSIVSARWDTPQNPVPEGTIVGLETELAGDCSGKQISFTIKENDPFLDDTVDTAGPASTVLESGTWIARSSWTTQWVCDGLPGFCGTPEYYFVAEVINEGTPRAQSIPPHLEVTQGGTPLPSPTPSPAPTVTPIPITQTPTPFPPASPAIQPNPPITPCVGETTSLSGDCVDNLTCLSRSGNWTIDGFGGCTGGNGCCVQLATAPAPGGGGLGGQEALCGASGIDTAIGCIPVESPQELITFILRWAVGIAGGIALLMSIYAGFQMITSSGDPKQIQAAKHLLTSAIGGLLFLILGAYILRLIGIEILQIPGF